MFADTVMRVAAPNRVRGDYGTENNGVEAFMNLLWGVEHKGFIRGKYVIKYYVLINWTADVSNPRSQNNVRIERFWRDLRKDVLEAYRLLFASLERQKLLDMSDPMQSMVLFLVFAHRIQASIDRAVLAWNSHQVRSEGNQEPRAIFELGRVKASRLGYWKNDARQDLEAIVSTASALARAQAIAANNGRPPTAVDEFRAGLRVHDDARLNRARQLLHDVDLEEDDGNWGIEVYLKAVPVLYARVAQLERDAESGSESE